MSESHISSQPSTSASTSTRSTSKLKKQNEKMEKSVKKKAKRSGKKKRRGCKKKEPYSVHISRVMKQIDSKAEISAGGMATMNSFVNDLFGRIATEASHLAHYSNRSTVGDREIQTAVRLILPGDLAKYAILEGNKAIKRFMTSK